MSGWITSTQSYSGATSGQSKVAVGRRKYAQKYCANMQSLQIIIHISLKKLKWDSDMKPQNEMVVDVFWCKIVRGDQLFEEFSSLAGKMVQNIQTSLL